MDGPICRLKPHPVNSEAAVRVDDWHTWWASASLSLRDWGESLRNAGRLDRLVAQVRYGQIPT